MTLWVPGSNASLAIMLVSPSQHINFCMLSVMQYFFSTFQSWCCEQWRSANMNSTASLINYRKSQSCSPVTCWSHIVKKTERAHFTLQHWWCWSRFPQLVQRLYHNNQPALKIFSTFSTEKLFILANHHISGQSMSFKVLSIPSAKVLHPFRCNGAA